MRKIVEIFFYKRWNGTLNDILSKISLNGTILKIDRVAITNDRVAITNVSIMVHKPSSVALKL